MARDLATASIALRPRLVAQAISDLEEQHSTWGRADVAEALATRLPPGALGSAEEVRRFLEQAADVVISNREVVRLGAEPLPVPEHLRRRDGLSAAERHGGARFSTRVTLAREQAVLEALGRGREAGVALAEPLHVAQVLEGSGLGPDQRGAVERLCLGGERLSVLVGPAGSGKTRALAAARNAWEGSGVPVRGLAPSAVAVGVLAEEAGVASETLAKFLHDHERGQASLRRGEVVILDEAAMVSTGDLARLVELVERAEGKLVTVGDPHQLSSVGAGGLFRLLARDARAIELTGIRRFREDWEAAATRRLREGDEAVLAQYEDRGRVSGGDRPQILEGAYRAWADARRAGESVVIMAPDNASVDALAMRCRAARVAVGEVEEGGLQLGDQVVGDGDEVVTTRNARRLVTTAGAWVRNGDRWAVTERRANGSLALSSLEGRGRVVLPAGYVAEHVGLSYAVTVHKGQGLTLDHGVLVVDRAATAEHLYVGMTRGRVSNHAFVVCEEADTDHGRHRLRWAHDVLASALRRSSAERSATEVHLVETGRADDLATRQVAMAEPELRRCQEVGRADGRQDALAQVRPAQPGRTSCIAGNLEEVSYLADLERRIAYRRDASLPAFLESTSATDAVVRRARAVRQSRAQAPGCESVQLPRRARGPER